MLRALVFVGWVIGSIVAWWCVIFLVGQAVGYFVNERQVHLPNWFFVFFNYGFSLGGTLLIPAVIATFALRGKLPGTVRIKAAAT